MGSQKERPLCIIKNAFIKVKALVSSPAQWDINYKEDCALSANALSQPSMVMSRDNTGLSIAYESRRPSITCDRSGRYVIDYGGICFEVVFKSNPKTLTFFNIEVKRKPA